MARARQMKLFRRPRAKKPAPDVTAKARIIRNRDARSDAIHDVMHDRYRAMSIDTLLTHPIDAIRMAADAAHRAGEMSNATVRQIERGLHYIAMSSPASAATITEMLRTALADRKRGDGRLRKDRV